MIAVDSNKCPQDHKCPMLVKCPQKALSQDGFKLPKVDLKKCVECLFCVENCPKKAFYKV